MLASVSSGQVDLEWLGDRCRDYSPNVKRREGTTLCSVDLTRSSSLQFTQSSMSDRVTVEVPFPADESGMVGRECPSCQRYFKVKPGTGLPISECICPYCEHRGHSSDFTTPAQLEYLKSVVVKRFVEPSLKDFQRSLHDLERSTRGSFISFKVHTSEFDFPIKYYTEQKLETTVTCDSCGLVFSIFGVFASCPDCARLTSMSIFQNSLRAARRRLAVLASVPDQERELREVILVDAISASVASFDSLGKRLAREFPIQIPDKPRNLFQNIDGLNEVVGSRLSVSLSQLTGPTEYSKIRYMFQVRHISTHNFGEVDDDFIKKTGCHNSLKGSKPQVAPSDVEEFISLVENLGIALRDKLRGCA